MEVGIERRVLEWAVERSGRSEEFFAKKYKNFFSWLSGDKLPTLKQLQSFAKDARVPFGFLLLPEPPIVNYAPLADFRTRGGSMIDEYSPDLRDVLEMVKERQEWLAEYKKNNGYGAVPLVGSIKKGMSEKQIASNILLELKVDADWRKSIKNKRDAFSYFLSKVEDQGIAVFVSGTVGFSTRRTLKVSEFRGFALSDEYAPVIFINASDAPAGRLFTLFHELVHICKGEDGLDDGTEAFCNRIAAMCLVPHELFLQKWRESPQDFDGLENFFKVSKQVLFRTALTLRLISDGEYRMLMTAFEKDFERHKKSSGGGDFYRSALYKCGKGFLKYLNEAVQEGDILYRDAYHLTGLRGDAFAETMKRANTGVDAP